MQPVLNISQNTAVILITISKHKVHVCPENMHDFHMINFHLVVFFRRKSGHNAHTSVMWKTAGKPTQVQIA